MSERTIVPINTGDGSTGIVLDRSLVVGVVERGHGVGVALSIGEARELARLLLRRCDEIAETVDEADRELARICGGTA
ncbi:MAG: hypothetical protein RID91_08965 [Azospirillaceae bacterium]